MDCRLVGRTAEPPPRLNFSSSMWSAVKKFSLPCCVWNLFCVFRTNVKVLILLVHIHTSQNDFHECIMHVLLLGRFGLHIKGNRQWNHFLLWGFGSALFGILVMLLWQQGDAWLFSLFILLFLTLLNSLVTLIV